MVKKKRFFPYRQDTYSKTVLQMIRYRYVKFLITVLVVLIASSLTAGLGALTSTFTPLFLENYSSGNAPDIICKYIPNEEDIAANKYGFSSEEIEKIKGVNNIKETSNIFSYDYLTDKEENNLRLIKYQNLQENDIALPTLLKGDYPKNNQYVLDEGYYIFETLIQDNIDDSVNHDIGDMVDITFSMSGTDVKVKLKVVGICDSPLYNSKQKERALSLDEQYVHDIFFTDDNSLGVFASFLPVTDVYLVLNEKDEYYTSSYKNQVDTVASKITSLFPIGRVRNLTLEENTSYALFKSYTEKINVISILFPLFFIAICALVLLIITSKLIAEERGCIACYFSLGISKEKIFAKYLIFIFISCLIGVIAGYFIGVTMVPSFIYNTYKAVFEMFPFKTNIFSPMGIIVSFIIVILGGIMTNYSTMKTLRETPAELMKPKAPEEGKKILLERLPSLWNKLPFSLKSSIRNIFRHKKNLILISLTVIGSMVLVFMGFSLNDASEALKNSVLFANVANSMGLVSALIIVYGIVMAALIIYALASINIDERIREIAVLKVLGYHDKECALYAFRELIMITIVAGLIGLPVSMLVTHLFFTFLDFGTLGDVQWYTYVLSYLIILISSILSSFMLYPKIKKIDFNISLKSVE